jgi:hypothetical protein
MHFGRVHAALPVLGVGLHHALASVRHLSLGQQGRRSQYGSDEQWFEGEFHVTVL